MFEVCVLPGFYFRDVQYEDGFMLHSHGGHGPDYCSRNNHSLHLVDKYSAGNPSWAWPLSMPSCGFATLNPYSEDEYVHLAFSPNFQTLGDSEYYEDNDGTIVDFPIFPFLT